jgi:hypothetical protein
MWIIFILAVSLESGNANGERICIEPETGNNYHIKVMFHILRFWFHTFLHKTTPYNDISFGII